MNIYISCFLSVLFIFISEISQAQSYQKQVEGIATYTHRSYGPQAPYETHLQFKGKKAWYSHYKKKETLVSNEGYNFHYYKENSDWYYTGDSLYYFVDDENYVPYFGRWAAEPITWEITDETQMIAGYLARKAITKPLNEAHPSAEVAYKNTNIIAWFTTDIPLNVGPKGYYGLPGLIVKLEYSNIKIDVTTLKSVEFKEVEDWALPSLEKKIEVSKDHAYNPWKLGEKWFKKKKKELGF